MAAQRKRKTSSQTQTVTAGTTIRLEQPKSGRGKKSNVAIVVQEINPVSGFVGFLRENAVVGLAVGFAIATQAQALIKQLLDSFINPLYALFFEGGKLSAKTTTLQLNGRESSIAWGQFAYTLLNFLFVLAAIYAIIKIFNLDKLSKPKDKK